MQGKVIGGVIVAVLVGGGAFFFAGNNNGTTTEEEFEWGLQIVIFNVGQADAIVMVEPDGQAVVIDAGRGSTAAGQIADFLGDELENGFGVIDEVKVGVVTHYDVDHMGGFASFDDLEITFKTVYDQGPSPMRAGKPKYTAYLAWVGDPNDNLQADTGEDFIRKEARVGIHFTLGDAKIKIISARGDTKGSQHDISLDPQDGTDFHDNENPGSIALLVTLGDFEFYTAGDQTSDDWKSEPDTEIAVTNSGVITGGNDIDVLKVNHHGSDTSTGTLFVQAIDPEVAIISTKISSNHRLPKLVAIKQLIENGALVYITGNGLKSDGTFNLSAKQGDDEGYTPPANGFINEAGDVHILVSKDGKTYRVRGAGEWREFSAVDSENPH